jgi:LmbE family N-acetylglucosaminyl deacetylase
MNERRVPFVVERSPVFGWGRASSALDAGLTGLGIDRTEEIAERPALVVAPHPDDETLGCGATILRKTDAGASVWVVFVTDGRRGQASPGIDGTRLAAIREHESLEACRRLGVARGRVIHLRFEEGCLARDREALGRCLVDIVSAVRPEQIFVSSGLDGHEDHRDLQEVVIDLHASGDIEGELYEYPIWYWSENGRARWVRRAAARLLGIRWRTGGLARGVLPMLVRTTDYLDRKRFALDAHVSQMKGPPGERSATTLHDVANGSFLRSFFGKYEVFFRIGQ